MIFREQAKSSPFGEPEFLCFYCACSKREKAYCRKLEELLSERDSHNGYAPNGTANKGGKSNFPTENDYPKDVEKRVSEFDIFVNNLFAKRRKAKPRNFKTLNAKRNPDDSYAKQNPRKNPFKPKQKSAEDYPEDVSQSFHNVQPFIKYI